MHIIYDMSHGRELIILDGHPSTNGGYLLLHHTLQCCPCIAKDVSSIFLQDASTILLRTFRHLLASFVHGNVVGLWFYGDGSKSFLGLSTFVTRNFFFFTKVRCCFGGRSPKFFVGLIILPSGIDLIYHKYYK